MKYSYENIQTIVADRLLGHSPLIIGIDGCCASGKTTLAQRLAADFEADLIHMDDFFLPPSLRTPNRYREPGGNVHYERFYDQIARPLLTARERKEPLPRLSWERFLCSAQTFASERSHTLGRPLLIIEGSYCMRPEFRPLYDLMFFLKTPYEEQKKRILARSSSQQLQMFTQKWIPLENHYFSHYQIEELCTWCIET